MAEQALQQTIEPRAKGLLCSAARVGNTMPDSSHTAYPEISARQRLVLREQDIERAFIAKLRDLK